MKTFNLTFTAILALLLLTGCGSVNGGVGTSYSTTATNYGDTGNYSPEGKQEETSPDIRIEEPPKPVIRKAQFKKTIAVSRFENRTTAAGQINLGSGMSDQLTNSLVQSDNFVVLERQGLSDVLQEQDFARSGRARKSTTAQTGQVIPAQILIKGTITEFQQQESGSGAGVSYMGFTVGTESTEAHVALILRIIDTTSGQVLDSVRLEGKARGTGYKFGVSYMGVGFEAEKFANTALNKAVQTVIDQATQMIARNLNEIPFEGKIIKVQDDTFYTNIGARNRVSGGDVFDVYSPGAELVDPDTGEKLGSLKKKVGTVVISMPKEKFSKAFSSQGELYKEGYILREKGTNVSDEPLDTFGES